jgi:hypothetical protein
VAGTTSFFPVVSGFIIRPETGFPSFEFVVVTLSLCRQIEGRASNGISYVPTEEEILHCVILKIGSMEIQTGSNLTLPKIFSQINGNVYI